jgi:DNA polymerase-3 subunit gamma/tau
MSYEVIARKWRPQKFSEVVGQPHLVRTLLNALSTGRIAHAYLFVGPRGTGKTSTARLLAKALNCQNPSDTHEPCGECDSCREIASATSLDVIEIDAASNTGVDSIRDLRDKVRYAPARGPYKIYIIDEVHMLSIGAFNALLKTLEEPPEHAKFILATTDVQKVPTTILSRCQRFDLRRIRLPDILSRLEEICAAEHWYVDPAALLAIARGAEGGLRDAESALDQLVSFRGTTITEADALDVFGLASWDVISSLAHDLLAGETGKALTTLSRLDAAGRDLPRVLQELLGSFRNLLVLLHAPELVESFDLTVPQQESLKALGKLTDGEKLLRVVEILSAAATAARFALSPKTVLEVAFIRAARAAQVVSIDELVEDLKALGGTPPADPVIDQRAAATAMPATGCAAPTPYGTPQAPLPPPPPPVDFPPFAPESAPFAGEISPFSPQFAQSAPTPPPPPSGDAAPSGAPKVLRASDIEGVASILESFGGSAQLL